MTSPRKVEIFSAGCPICEESIRLVKRIACPSCEVVVHDTNDPAIDARARQLGVRGVPAVLVDGMLASCCTGRGPEEASLRAAGIGTPR